MALGTCSVLLMPCILSSNLVLSHRPPQKVVRGTNLVMLTVVRRTKIGIELVPPGPGKFASKITAKNGPPCHIALLILVPLGQIFSN